MTEWPCGLVINQMGKLRNQKLVNEHVCEALGVKE